jgi:hypothetical protein
MAAPLAPETHDTATVRPPVSVIVPFLGSASEAHDVAAALGRLETRAGDELIVANNGAAVGTEVPAELVEAGLLVVAAGALRSSYYARNVAAATAANEWLLFLDADCRPSATLLDDYFAEPLGERCGIGAGEIVAAPEQSSLPARHARARGHLGVADHLDKGPHPAGPTANLLVRRAVWEELGGFCEVRSGADLEFCWRAAERGWELAYRPGAEVEHLHAETLRAMLRKGRRYGPGQLWAHRRFPSFHSPPDVLYHLVRAIVGVPLWILTGRLERGAFKAIDLLWHIAYAWGYWTDDNRAPAGAAANPGGGDRRRGFALRRPFAPKPWPAAAGVEYAEDQGVLERVRGAIWLAVRHPLRFLAARRRGELRLRELGAAARRLRGAPEIAHGPEGDPAGAEAVERLRRLLGVSE